MIYESITKANKNYKRDFLQPEEIQELMEKPYMEVADYVGKNFLEWIEPYREVFEYTKVPRYQFFKGGKFNPFYNVIEKHLNTKNKNKAAIIWRGSDYTEKIYTYQSLSFEASKLAYAFKKLGVKKGDKVLIYIPNIPEAIIVMLACVRIGAIHAFFHFSYSADALAERIDDCRASLIVTANYSLTGNELDIKTKVDAALKKSEHQPKHVVVVERIPKKVHMKPLRDIWYHDLLSDTDFKEAVNLESTILSFDDPLFIMITTTHFPEPKGLVYSAAGFLGWAHYTFKLIFDPKDGDTIWNTTDIAWMNSHNYKIYGPLMAGATSVMFEDSIQMQNARRFYGIVERYNINKCYMSPRIIKALMNADMKKKVFERVDSLELFFLGGEPIEEDVLYWLYRKLGKDKLPVLNIYSVTELGSAVAAQLPGFSKVKKDSVGQPIPGVDLAIYDSITKTKIKYQNEKGLVSIEKPLMSMCTSLCHGEELFYKTFWKYFDEKYVFRVGDAGCFDEESHFYLSGRVDDIVHVAGKRINLQQIEETINKHKLIKESAIIILNDEKKGDSLIAFCVLKKNVDESNYSLIIDEINEVIIEELGEPVLPQYIKFVRVLPKGADGVVLRDLLKEIAMQM
ncbi:AMP-binding protein [Deferribacterales bacterium Es71-Z0220]|uniref:AMP-binding protein n=1 Tax=Deferrivibrio essentukiensis TaxID=2880922 RepID=UPI001F612D6D|nr:AMP-binding protein [Deferrivibrio essentukiensis]MCB4204662.1 AMP-binding protein [Deferrivibrio essentukiensis]